VYAVQQCKNITCAFATIVLSNIANTYGFKRTELTCSREASTRRELGASLPNLVSAVYLKPILESRLSAVYFGILVVQL
jgi:hypothetical protein